MCASRCVLLHREYSIQENSVRSVYNYMCENSWTLCLIIVNCLDSSHPATNIAKLQEFVTTRSLIQVSSEASKQVVIAAAE